VAARAAAEQLLAQLKLPPGAVKTGLGRGVPATLWRAVGPMAVARRVDVYEVWRIPGSVQHLLDWIAGHAPAHSQFIGGDGGGPSPNVLATWTQGIAFPLADHGKIWRMLVLRADVVAGGATALRVDAEGARLIPRPVSERIPSRIERIVKAGVRPQAITARSAIADIVDYMNALPVQQPGAARCTSRKGATLIFYAPGSKAPVATAADRARCLMISITIDGHPQPPLEVDIPVAWGRAGANVFKLHPRPARRAGRG
jgi:hypothetical protein